jgi:hypothetical protein
MKGAFKDEDKNQARWSASCTTRRMAIIEQGR